MACAKAQHVVWEALREAVRAAQAAGLTRGATRELRLGFVCEAGKHRSVSCVVTVAERLGAALRAAGIVARAEVVQQHCGLDTDVA